MEEAAYESLYASEDTHWWFVGRRAISRALLKRFVPTPHAQVLEVGCGSGGNFEMLKEFGAVITGIEMHPTARARAQARGNATVVEGYLPDHLPTLAPQTLIAAFDVIEHVEDDLAALRTVYNLLAPGGVFLMTVPALPWMWSEHDVHHHHFRRYTRKQLKERLEAAGFSVVQLSYFNTLLSPLIVLVRCAGIVLKRSLAKADAAPAAPINTWLAKIFSCERHLLGLGYRYPFGISLLAVAKRL